jgi:hypothetical protein
LLPVEVAAVFADLGAMEERCPDVHDDTEGNRCIAGAGILPSVNGQLISPRRVKAVK